MPSVKVRNLGVILDQSLTFDDHISAICQSVHFHIRSIGKVRKLLSFDACASLIHALIGSRLDYCNSILYNLPDSKISRLQRVQNQAARILTRSPRREHITPVLKLHWLKVRERIRYKILILTHKAFYGNAPPYHFFFMMLKKLGHLSKRHYNRKRNKSFPQSLSEMIGLSLILTRLLINLIHIS